ncbi:unnamed protein product [Rotaria sp. Silwood2]|nr:unnamed protein product [Rotaria sp. Silwood2]CAF2536216.1 unnamed protein product [Rotaria sp. Silwood2]CAF2788429.1 unnamed protein product [Rotaria sp. Silwood2]CAF2933686.1 unnamed protein product [Rotaria sp. Silwood2]CAF3897979.1 unnamed protein product [Rotaria sp. Silwood2]
MFNDWILRPSSAHGNLQSHPCFQSSLLDDGHAPGTVDEWRKTLTSNKPQLRMANINRNAEDYDQNLEIKSYFQSFKNLRRLTIANPTNIQQYEVILLKRAKCYALVGLKGELKPKKEDDTRIEERLNINALELLKRAFTQNITPVDLDIDESGQMNLEEFTRIVKRCIGSQRSIDDQIENLFNKIDYNAEQIITWDELCTFLQLNFNEKADAEYHTKEISFLIPAKIQKTPHRYPCSTIVLSPDHQYLALGSDGTISVWTPNGDLKIAKSVAATAGIDQTLTARERLEKRKDQQTRSQPKWITDCQIIPEFNKVVVSTGDRELQFWDQTYCFSTSREVQTNDLPCTQICSLDSVPIKLNYGITSPDELLLIYGDTDGCVNILIFLAAREIFRLLTTLERRKGIPTVNFDRFLDAYKCDYVRWQVHREWIEYIYYDSRLNQIISCSNDQHTAVVIGCIRASASSEIQLTENGFAELKTSQAKSNDLKGGARRRRGTMSTDLNDESTLPSVTNIRHKRDSTTSYLTHSSSQDTHSRKAGLQEMRTDVVTATTSRSNIRRQPIIRNAQLRCDADQTVFKIHKGAKTFDLCTGKNVLVTGGMDRVIRLWNPYLPSRPVARLRGHNAPVFLVKIAVEDDRLFSISADKTVLVSFILTKQNFYFDQRLDFYHEYIKKTNSLLFRREKKQCQQY